MQWSLGKGSFILVEKTRVEVGRNAESGYGLIDSQSTKTTFASEERGYGGGNMGNILHIVVHAANITDTMAGAAMLKRLLNKYLSLKSIFGDAGYRGTFVLAAKALGLTVDISERIKSAL